MIVYVDATKKCHLSDDGNRTAVETDFFNGKCEAFVEGFLLNVDSNGGIMITPWKDYNILAAYQKQYEADLAEQTDMQTALETLGVTVNGKMDK